MVTKQVRITTVAEDIVKEYAGHDSISRGIMRMKEVLADKDREIARLKGISDNLQKPHWMSDGSLSQHNQKYWERFKLEVRAALEDIQRRY